MGLFGKNKKELWEQLSKEIHGEIIEGKAWMGDRLEIAHDNWILYLSSDSVPTGDTAVTYTTMRAPFLSKDGLMFKIYKHSVFSDLGKMFGMQDIPTGHDEFDKDFVIKGNDEAQIARLFNNKTIRKLILKQPQLSLEIRSTAGTEDGDKEKELYFNILGVIKDVDQLKDLFDLFMEVLDELVNIDSAYAIPTGIEIYEDEDQQEK